MLDTLSKPVIQRLFPENNLWGVFFTFMKIVAASFVIQRALINARERKAFLNYVIETSSGTAALALAYAAQERSLPLVIVGDSAIEPNLLRELQNLDVEVHLVDDEYKNKPGGFQAARLARLKAILNERPGGVWLKQYDNPDWPCAYLSVAAEIIRQLGPIDFFVCGTGSGASSCGIIKGLRAAGTSTQLIAVDSVNSILFGAPEGPRDLRGVGMGLLPANLDQSLFDEVFWVDCATSWTAANQMHRLYGVPVGPTTGAAWLVARHLARAFPDQKVVFLGPDSSKRYEPLIFDPKALQDRGWWLNHLPDLPIEVSHPASVRPDLRLQRFMWNRRTLEQVLQTPPL
jgi:cysteine synthase